LDQAELGEAGQAQPDNAPPPDPYFDPAVYRRTIDQLRDQLQRLRDIYAQTQQSFNESYNISCSRRDGTHPSYKFADYTQSRVAWRNNSLMNRSAGLRSVDQPHGERANEDIRQRFEAAGFADVLQRDNPARYLSRAEIVMTDEHLSAIDSILKGLPADREPTRWRSLFVRAAGPAMTALLLDPVFAILETRLRPGSKVLCFGTLVPYVECRCLRAGAVPTTVSPIRLRYATDRVTSVDQATVTSEGLTFDFAVAALTIGRAGLGVFGEEIDDGADRATMQWLRRALAPGGRLVASFFVGPGALLYNVARVYDDAGLARLFEGWQVTQECALKDPMFPVAGPEHDPDCRVRLRAFALAPA
jgi:hypothetical protein